LALHVVKLVWRRDLALHVARRSAKTDLALRVDTFTNVALHLKLGAACGKFGLRLGAAFSN